MKNQYIEVVPLPFPLIAKLLKQREDDLANYIWEEDVDNIKKAEDDIVERNKREEEVLAKNFKQSIDSLSIGLKPASLKPANLNNIKSTLKKNNIFI